jgi:hypothetical protein
VTINARAIVVGLVLGAFGCSPHDGFDRALHSSNHEEISDLRILMAKHAVPHKDTDPQNGMEGFAYRSADRQRFEALRKKLNRQTSVKFKELEARDYLQKLLTEMNHDFIISEKPDGTWIKWFPESEQQDNDVSMKVVQHIFDLQAKRASADCKPSAAPSNSTLVADARQERPRAAQCGR